jgi:hypothetical protein
MTVDELKRFYDYSDWPQVFQYADGFTIDDVIEIVCEVDGENDGESWVMVGRLKTKQYFVIDAGCDYTGWDCGAFGSSSIWKTKRDAILLGLSDRDRGRMSITIESTDSGYRYRLPKG